MFKKMKEFKEILKLKLVLSELIKDTEPKTDEKFLMMNLVILKL